MYQLFAKAVSATSNVMYSYLLIILLPRFAFTTLLGNLFYCEGCLNYIAGQTLSARFMKGTRKTNIREGQWPSRSFLRRQMGAGIFCCFTHPKVYLR